MTRESDYAYDDIPMNEVWWEWLDEIGGINPGDEIIVETSTREWKNRMTVLDENWQDEITFQTQRGKKYMIVTYSTNHSLEKSRPMVRTCDNFDSRGVIERVEVYK